jgi:hypothetical protein
MGKLNGRLKREHDTLTCMTQIYCKDHHNQQDGGLCPNCGELMAYSETRLAKCPYGQEKPTCAKCPIHCYKKEKREQVREVMRYAGPRMPLRHPIQALTHVFDKLRRVVHPRVLRRARNRKRELPDQIKVLPSEIEK